MRRRMLNPEFFADSDIISNFEPYGRLFYQGLWCVAEDSGCFEMNVFSLKMKIFPGDNIEVSKLEEYLNKLTELNKVVTYETNGKKYGWIRNFFKHQRLDKPSPPTLPLPEFITFQGKDFSEKRHEWKYIVMFEEDSWTCRRNVVDDATPEVKLSEVKLSEVKRKEEKEDIGLSSNSPASSGKVKYAQHVSMTEAEYKKLCEEYGKNLITEMIEDLNNWKGGKGKRTKDDYLTIRAWIRKDKKNLRPNTRGQPRIPEANPNKYDDIYL